MEKEPAHPQNTGHASPDTSYEEKGRMDDCAGWLKGKIFLYFLEGEIVCVGYSHTEGLRGPRLSSGAGTQYKLSGS